MMVKIVVSHKSSVISVLLFLFLLTTYNLQLTTCLAQPISSSELINNAKEYDKKTVVYEGEVIGDVMQRGDYAWLNLNDGANAIGVWAKKEIIPEITYIGSYKFKGDRLQVSGIFNRACPEHGGDLEIHAQSITVVGVGAAVPERASPGKKRIVFLLLGGLCLVWILRQFRLR